MTPTPAKTPPKAEMSPEPSKPDNFAVMEDAIYAMRKCMASMKEEIAALRREVQAMNARSRINSPFQPAPYPNGTPAPSLQDYLKKASEAVRSDNRLMTKQQELDLGSQRANVASAINEAWQKSLFKDVGCGGSSS